ncbi:MAG: hypothetical protein CL470_07335 [Acidimicrobiaceae bacterium]|nr:hypothetical protein [Acidimicrobiaceae bacterium]|tara:strand:+ start:454 stop:1125 length:672 start_codon:yes stop_codon:yes gene_type:complete
MGITKINNKSRQALEAAIFDYGGVMSFSPLWRVQILADEMDVPKEVFSKIIFGTSGENDINPWHEAECGRQILNDEFATQMQIRLAPYGGTFDLDIFLPWVSEAINEADEEIIKVVEELRCRGYPVALLTNAVKEFRPVIEKTIPIYDLFDVIIDSSEVGMRKPEREIYDLTAKELGVANSDCLMIDDLPVNVDGANEAGMTGLLFSDSKGTARKIREYFNLS